MIKNILIKKFDEILYHDSLITKKIWCRRYIFLSRGYIPQLNINRENMDASEEDNVRGTKEETYDFDELLTKKVGEFGRKQRFLSMLLTSSATCTCLQSLSSVFIAG